MCLLCSTSFDQARADAFATKFVGFVNGAGLMLMTSLGHRTGLFDAMSDAAPYTSDTLAEKANLSERYVREWLGAMTTGGIVTYDGDSETYHLPREHAAFLTRAASPNNLAVTSQFVSVLGAAEDYVADAFRHGRGVPYSAYKRFHTVMAEESNQSVIAGLDEHILPLVDGLEDRLARGIDAVDVGCGSGFALMHLAKRFPKSRFTGLDLSDETIAKANKTARSRGLANLKFELRDLTHWNPAPAFDLVTAFDAIHDQARPDLVLRHIRSALRPDGVFLMQDIKASSRVDGNDNQPLAPFIYTISTMHCMSVSLAQGGIGVGAAWGRELACKMLGEAGFTHVDVKELPHDIMNYYYLAT